MTKTVNQIVTDEGIYLIELGDAGIAQRDEWKRTYLNREGMEIYEQARQLPAGPLRDEAVAKAVRA